jgi:hypothetical protein
MTVEYKAVPKKVTYDEDQLICKILYMFNTIANTLVMWLWTPT